MGLIVTFTENGVDKVSDYTGSNKSEKEITTLIHNHSYRENLVKFLKEFNNNKPLDELSTVSLGYALEKLKEARINSTVSRIEFHHGKTIHNFGVTLDKLKRKT